MTRSPVPRTGPTVVADTDLDRAAAGVVLASFAGPVAPPWVLDGLAAGLAGVVLFGSNVVDPAQLAALCAALRAAGGDPVLAIDEEGGDVTRLAHATGSPYPGNAALGAADDLALTRQVYRALGAELAAVGVGVDLAPSVDVNTAADNPIIGTRAFGADPDLVARHGVAAVAGLREAGVAACVKHFPGHGATSDDSHLGLPTVDVPLEVLRARELVPFRAAVAAGTPCVMTAHIRVPALTGELPATLSAGALGALLRTELGFTGVVVTDALDMHGASGRAGIPATAADAFVAGADLLCIGSDPGPEVVAATVAAVADAVRRGRAPRARLEESRARVAALPRPPGGPGPGGAALDRAVGLRAARAALQARGPLPALHRPVVAQVRVPATIAAGPVPWGIAPWLAPGDGEVVDVDEAGPGPAALLARAAGRDLVLVVRDSHRYPWMAGLVERLVAERPDAVVVEMGLPVWRPRHAGAFVATHGAARANAAAAMELLGLTPAPG
jgi:beta-N-acetylhexosaminidase